MKAILSLSVILLVFVCVPLVHADADAAQARIAERISEIDALKTAGLVGEDNKGYLAARGDLDNRQRQLMRDDNADRKIIYEAIASRVENSNAEAVGRQRARRIRESAAPGVWLQRPDGAWYQK